MPKQNNVDFCSSSSESVLNIFKNLPLTSTSTSLIKSLENEHNLEIQIITIVLES